MLHTIIGLFGGTFDPPHIGHTSLANKAFDQFNLSRLLWMLTPNPPHKQENIITPVEHRIEMVNRAIADNPTFEISLIEAHRPGPHYTIDTLNLLKQQEPDSDIILLIGGDSLRDLPTWRHNIDLVAAVKKLGVMRRPGDSFDMRTLEKKIPGITEKVNFIDAQQYNISSRNIRHLIAEGQPYQQYLIPDVYEYIEVNHLYRRK